MTSAHLRSVPGRLLRTCKVGGALHLLLRGGLREAGWFESHHLRRPVDAAMQPLPWYTYACTSFLEERLHRGLRVFEFGAGNSTLWYGERAGEVIAVERAARWASEVTAAGATVILRERDDEFVAEIREHGSFHVVAVDGHERPACARAALGSLTPDGVIVWDDSERDECRAVVPELEQGGFRELPFGGMRPIVPRFSRTSIFYRPGNCLGI